MVTLVTYPAADANSYITNDEADVILNSSIQYESWADLNKDEQNRRLINTYKKFQLVKNFVPPDTDYDCLETAQAESALHDLVFNLVGVQDTQQVRINNIGPMTREYFKNENLDRMSPDDFPVSVWDCLENFGGERPPTMGGVGSFAKTR